MSKLIAPCVVKSECTVTSDEDDETGVLTDGNLEEKPRKRNACMGDFIGMNGVNGDEEMEEAMGVKWLSRFRLRLSGRVCVVVSGWTDWG